MVSRLYREMLYNLDLDPHISNDHASTAPHFDKMAGIVAVQPTGVSPTSAFSTLRSSNGNGLADLLVTMSLLSTKI